MTIVCEMNVVAKKHRKLKKKIIKNENHSTGKLVIIENEMKASYN